MKVDCCSLYVKWHDGYVSHLGDMSVELVNGKIQDKKLWWWLGFAFIKHGFNMILFGRKRMNKENPGE